MQVLKLVEQADIAKIVLSLSHTHARASGRAAAMGFSPAAAARHPKYETLRGRCGAKAPCRRASTHSLQRQELESLVHIDIPYKALSLSLTHTHRLTHFT